MTKKNNKKLVVLLIIVLIVILIISWNIGKPKGGGQEAPSETPSYELSDESMSLTNSWNNVVPGKHSIGDVEALLGTKMSSVRVPYGYTKNEYNWRGKGTPVTVFYDQQGIVQHLRVPLFETEKGIMDRFISEWNLGQANFEKYVVKNNETKMYVFLDDGIAFEASAGKEVYYTIYFNPTTETEFMKVWNVYLTDVYEPHKHGIMSTDSR